MKESAYPSEWLEIARKDFKRAKLLLEMGDVEAAGFFLQQSIEKYLKAFALHLGLRLRKIHELDALLDDVVEHAPGLERFRAFCERASGYYLLVRYPIFFGPELTEAQLRADIDVAERLIEVLEGELGP